MSDPTWDLYQSLHAVLQSGSLSAASRSRGLAADRGLPHELDTPPPSP